MPGRTAARVGIALAVALAVVALPLVVDDRFLLKVLTLVGINVIIVIGLSLLFGYAGQISLGHAAFVGIGAYTSAILTSTFGWPWLAAVVVAIVLAAASGLVLAVPSLRLRGHYLAMATLGFGEIMFVLFVELREYTGGPDGFSGIPAPSVGALKIDSPAADYVLVWVVAIAVFVLAGNMVRLRPGRALKALHGSELGAEAAGVDTVRLKLKVFTLSTALAGLAGALYAHHIGFISPSAFSLQFSIVLVAMVVVGGMGSLWGAVVGAVLLTLLPFMDAIVPGMPREVAGALQDWQAGIYGMTLILVMIFAPGGLASAGRALVRRLRARGGESS
jgi:branched-chain amino acid transport system permease protein